MFGFAFSNTFFCSLSDTIRTLKEIERIGSMKDEEINVQKEITNGNERCGCDKTSTERPIVERSTILADVVQEGDL